MISLLSSRTRCIFTFVSVAFPAAFLIGLSPAKSLAKPKQTASFSQHRTSFRTRLTQAVKGREPLVSPPASFRLVRYNSPVGALPAYISALPRNSGKRPAIIWIVGGMGNDIGDTAWQPASPSNDQSASAFRRAGIVTMFPARRGGNNSPGYWEGFYGEVDDVLAAARYLAAQPFVDAKRIYLGGHSTGGTLALLVAAMPNQFRGIFSFGPVSDVRGYGADSLPFDIDNRSEAAMRAPLLWMKDIRRPTWILEGTQNPGNFDELQLLSRRNTNRNVRFLPVYGTDHFSILAPVTRLVAQKIVRDRGTRSNITFSRAELNAAVRR